ncbi:MAG TPA: hypothetical protein VLT82_02200 [Myxococcaceae bacterium]|nr:hypothetical protein [Myxococcaceae bacterium]
MTQSLHAAPSSSWRTRARDLLLRLVLPWAHDAGRFVVWAEMKAVDFDGEDTSLTEADLQLMK